MSSDDSDKDRLRRASREAGASGPAEGPSVGSLLRAPRLIVAVGASAGGLESLERLFAHIPPDCGHAFLVIQHLSPHHKTMMVELLARRTALDVRTATHGVSVRRDTVHVMPPGKRMSIVDGRLLLETQGGGHPQLPIDHFFSSLAADAGRRAVAVVLSGTGADGSRGIVDIRAQEGLVLAETEVTAAFGGMPGNAVASGCVDHSLAPEEMIEILQHHVSRLGRSEGGAGGETGHPADHEPDEEDDPSNVSARGAGRVLEMLHERYAIDFTQYKPSTVERRIERRVELSQAGGGMQAYIARLADDADELDAMYHDLLIGVTRFFRDESCFQKLELEVLPRLFAHLPPERGFRAWSAGCASGEEAYTLAMLVREQIEKSGQPIEAKIFATDLHPGALAHASLGVYTAEQLEHVSQARRLRHFEPCEGGFRLVDAVRQHVVFARHDVLNDAPFTRLDLVTCRNLLIYFEVPAQSKAIRLFHFSLRLDGVLMLGPSESLGRLSEDFSVIDETRRLYRKTRERRLPDDVRFEPPTLLPALPRGAATRPFTAGLPRQGASAAPSGAADARLLATYDLLLDRHMPTSVLVDPDERIVDTYGGFARWLRHPERRPEKDLFAALDTPATTELRHAVRQARLTGEIGLVTGVAITRPDGGSLTCDVRIEPVSDHRLPIEYVLLGFGERDPARVPEPTPDRVVDASGAAPSNEADAPGSDQLRQQNADLRSRLQQTAEMAETGREELQATNEELVAANEELQSSNEELNSVNEELHTVNSEYQGKISELRELNEDMNHLLASTDIGTVFLDRELRIRRFTPGIQRGYDLKSGDVGRSIESFAHRLAIDDLPARFGEVLRSGRAFEREVRDREGRALLLRILPYELSDQVAGVVLTLIDIRMLDDARVALADSERALQRRVAELQALYETTPAGLCFIDRQFHYVRANRAMSQIDGVPLENYAGRSVREVLPEVLAERVEALLGDVFATGEARLGMVMSVVTQAHPAEPVDYIVNYHPVREPGGDIVGCSCVIVERSAGEDPGAVAPMNGA